MTPYVNALKSIMSSRLKGFRAKYKLSQDSMSEHLHIVSRSYIELEHGSSLCCTCVFVFFLLLCERDEMLSLLQEISAAFSEISNGNDAA